MVSVYNVFVSPGSLMQNEFLISCHCPRKMHSFRLMQFCTGSMVIGAVFIPLGWVSMDVRCWLSDLTGSNCFFIAAFCLFCLLPLKPLCRSPLLLFTQRLVAPFLESAFSKIEFSVCLRFISPFKDHVATALTTKYYRTGVISTRSWIVPAPLVTNFNLLSKMASKSPQKD